MSVFSEHEMIKWTPLKVGKRLRCGCCGSDFQVWKGYQDQDQDNGYGICKKCQGWIEELDNKEMDKAIKVISDGLKPANKAKFDAMERELQIALVNKALSDGVMTWVIKPQQTFPITNLIKNI